MLRTWQTSLEENYVIQYIVAFVCSSQSLLSAALSSGSNNKYCVGLIVIILGSVYPLILKYTKNGQERYPFMIGVAVCVKNIFMLIYYFGRYLLYLYNEHSHTVYDWNDQSDNVSHSECPPVHKEWKPTSPSLSSPAVSEPKAAMNMFGSTPSKLSWAFNVLQPSSLHNAPRTDQELLIAECEPLEMHADSDDDEDEDADFHRNLGLDANDHRSTYMTTSHRPLSPSNSIQSMASKQCKMNREYSAQSTLQNLCDWVSCRCSGDTARRRLCLYLYLAPNAILVLINDVLALYTLSFVSVSTYAVFMQVTILFIVIVRYFCLNKHIKTSQLLSVCMSIAGMIVFELVELEPKMAASESPHSVLTQEKARSDMIGISLCMVRGIFKACDLVYVEWFIHHLNEIPFYEKQAVVSVWFVVCSMFYVVAYHGTDIFVHHRSLFDGFNDITWVFVGYGTFFALMIYLLILRLDSMVMGFCQQMTVLFAVGLDVIVFGTKVTGAMWVSALIVVIAIIQYSVIQYEQMKTPKAHKTRRTEYESTNGKNGYIHPERANGDIDGQEEYSSSE